VAAEVIQVILHLTLVINLEDQAEVVDVTLLVQALQAKVLQVVMA
jgi:hypothetical protein